MENKIKALLDQSGYKCTSDVRTAIAKAVNGVCINGRSYLTLKEWAKVIEYAIEVGGAKPDSSYDYRNAQGGVSTAKVSDLYEIPENLINPMLVCFSGYVPAALYTLEAYRAYKVIFGKELQIFATGKGGNKGLFEKVFGSSEGLMVDTEAEMYMRIMEQFLDSDIVRQNQRIVADTDTKGNFNEMYQLAKAKGYKEVTLILCSGQPWYTKRLLAEGMLEYGKPEYADVKINLVVLDCPLTLEMNVPEGMVSEVMLGYIAASLGPLMKDTTPLTTEVVPDLSKERYLLPGVAEADWSKFEELITYYSNMGWPDYQELLYGVDHETAVYNVIMADLRARFSFSKESYEAAILRDIYRYESFLDSHKDRTPYFIRTVPLKLGWYDGKRHFTEYRNVGYLSYLLYYKCTSWVIDTWDIPKF
ncbi:MAG: hypothetical protein IKA03_05660 [Alphaproteobacteria bacterium]|nr:hypothetical protein [Alphaproteobacteria bacterium]